MRIRKIRFLAWIALLAMAPAGLLAYPRLVESNAAGSYAPSPEWSGVLRVWVSVGFPSDGLASWLSARGEAFERRRNGVRIQILPVETTLLQQYAHSSNPPDAIVYAPGTLTEPAHLTALSSAADWAKGLEDIGSYGDARYALPLAMGAYFWIANTEKLRCAPGAPACPETYLLCAPVDSEYLCWSAALLALFSGKTDEARTRTVLPGADLGLPETPEETVPITTGVPYRTPTSLPESFRKTESVISLFTAGDADAICATQTQLKRLDVLSESGRTPGYAVYAGGSAFTDQVVLGSAVLTDRPFGEERAALAAEYLSWLLTEDSQKALSSISLFRSVRGESLYGGYRIGMALAELSLEGGVIVPGAFDGTWRERCSGAADQFFASGGDAESLLRDALQEG